ncbi:uncharacterized protein LOC111936623 isoform X2 [Cyanistes caeruleus]|nr:uncharacterized protein LOC111936623 isoform X2 [Cyanistes caeruleus]
MYIFWCCAHFCHGVPQKQEKLAVSRLPLAPELAQRSLPLQVLWTSRETSYKLPTEVHGMSSSLAPLCAVIFKLKMKILPVSVELQTGRQSKKLWRVLVSGQMARNKAAHRGGEQQPVRAQVFPTISSWRMALQLLVRDCLILCVIDGAESNSVLKQKVAMPWVLCSAGNKDLFPVVE